MNKLYFISGKRVCTYDSLKWSELEYTGKQIILASNEKEASEKFLKYINSGPWIKWKIDRILEEKSDLNLEEKIKKYKKEYAFI
ncbi:MAG: hypothetical protein PHF86_14000 [Candidatus Nanoarchaeia archaeon]|nr:hypothetical protein [Candidatus Nanoarchaeia archaeon]